MTDHDDVFALHARLNAAGFKLVRMRWALDAYRWERGGRLYSAEVALEMLGGRTVADETVEVTRELLERGRGADGSWTPAQLRLLGVDWPPPRGWRSDVRGKRIPASVADEFIELRDAGQRDLFGGGNG